MQCEQNKLSAIVNRDALVSITDTVLFLAKQIREVVKTMVLERILTNVAKAEFWTIIADDTTDRSKKELTAICIRYLQQDADGVYIIKEDPVAVA